jgi:hypothetical protein
MEYVRDVLQIKSIERRIGRKLSEDECDGEPFLVQMPNGIYRMFRVHLIKFPWGLCERTVPLDVDSAEQNYPKNKIYNQWKSTGLAAVSKPSTDHFPFYESTHAESEDSQNYYEEEGQEAEKVQLRVPGPQCDTENLVVESNANGSNSERESSACYARMSDVQDKDEREFKSEAV